MNDLTERLRDALSTQADAVTFDPYAYDAIVRRRSRRRLLRFTTPIAAALGGIAIVVAAGVVARPAGDGRPPVATQPPAGPPVPGRLAAVRATDDSTVAEAAVVSPDAVDGDAYVTTGPVRNVAAVAALGDGVTFYAVATDACRNTLLRIGSGGVTELGRLPVGWLQGLAVSRDGTRIAYTLGAADPKTCDAGKDIRTMRTTLRVRTLATGAERAWTAIGAVGALKRLAWSPDGRTLAYDVDNTIATVDTAAPGDRLRRYDKPIDEFGGRPANDGCHVTAAVYLDDGRLVAAYYCLADVPGGAGAQETGVARFDPATNTFGETLFTIPGDVRPDCLAFDRTERHAFVCAEQSGYSGFDDRKSLFEWHGGPVAQRVEVRGVAPRMIAW